MFPKKLFRALCGTASALVLATSAWPAAALPVATADSSHPSAACLDTAISLPYEESFLSHPEPDQLILRGGFGDVPPVFIADLCAARNLDAARRVVRGHANHLWRLAVGRVQGRIETNGDLSAGDDRPLYWTRLRLTATLRQWQPRFWLSSSKRARLIADMDRISRGQDDLRFPGGKDIKRILITGFDPFTLFRDIRQANPSGASALALDGVTVQTASGPARIETALFPVRWRDFGDGMVEKALMPYFVNGPRKVDMFSTTSQGRQGRFDLEHFNGAWRAGFTDNENVCYRGTVPIPAGLPTVVPQPQWTVTSLPYRQMIAAQTGPFPVFDNRTIVEVPAGTPEEPVTLTCPAAPSPGTTRVDGPTEGSIARAGAGGTYLSNEIAYRATLLRDATGLDVPGGHIHTPILTGLSTDPTSLSTPTFEANREAISSQVRRLVIAAAGTLCTPGAAKPGSVPRSAAR